MQKNYARSLQALIATLLMVGCADGPTAPETIAKIEIPITCVELQSSASCQLVSKVLGVKGTILTDRPITWTSADTSLIRVSQAGQVTAAVNKQGSARSTVLTATTEGKTASITISVLPAPVSRIDVIQSDSAATPGDSVRLIAVLLSSTNDTLTGRSVQYITSDSTIGKVRQVPWVHILPYTGPNTRSLIVLISAEGKQATRGIVVRPLLPNSVRLTSPDTIVKSGSRLDLLVSVKDAKGVTLSGHSTVVSSSDTTIAKPVGSTTVLFGDNRSASNKIARLYASLNNLRDSVAIAVSPMPADKLILSLDTKNLAGRDSTQARARVLATDGTELLGRTILYASSDTTVASVSTSGRVITKSNRGAIGKTTTISATIEGLTASQEIIVFPDQIEKIVLLPSSNAPDPGDTVAFNTVFLSIYGDTLTGYTATLSSTDTTVATITASNKAVIKNYDGPEERRVMITAAAGNTIGTASLTVPPLVPSVISFARDTIVMGTDESRLIDIVTRSTRGRILLGRNVAFASQDTTIARVLNGVIITRKHTTPTAKRTAITASLGSLRDTLVILVEAMQAKSIVTDRDTIQLYPSQVDTLEATVFDSAGQRLDGRTIEWSITDTTVATVQNGIIAAKPYNGNDRRTTTITVATPGVAITLSLTVLPSKTWRIELEPKNIELFPGDTSRLQARVTDESGNALEGRQLTWSSSREDVITTDSTGLLSVKTASFPSAIAVAISASHNGVIGTASVAVKPISSDKAVVEVTMNWDVINAADQAGLQSAAGNEKRAPKTVGNIPTANNTLPLAITHVGARLIYPADNAAFSQSTTRAQAEAKGVITLEVPPTDSAVLWVVFANETGSSPSIVRFGVKQKVRVERGKRLEIPVDSLIISNAAWRVAGADTARLYAVDSIAQNRDSTFHNLWVEATDPFQINQSPTENQRVVSFSGSGGFGSNTSGWRKIRINSRNPRIGISHRDSTYTFQPYVVGTFFNLPGTRYHFGPQGRYRPFWDSFDPVAVANPSLTSSSIRFADSVLITFAPRDANGNSYLTPRTVVWSSSDTAVAIGRNTGYILGRRAGTAILTYTLGGVGGATGQINVTVNPSGRVIIPINWQQINQGRSVPVTTVGARLTYRGRNGAYTGAISRPTGTNESVLEFPEVASGDSVSLWMVYTNEKVLPSGTPDHTAALFGVLQNFRVTEGGTVTISADTITQIAPGWRIPSTEDQRLYSVDSLYSNRDDAFHYLNIEASDPFQIGQSPNFTARAILFSGSGSELGNSNGWRLLRITSRNPKIGVTHRDAVFTFRPYVASELFGLPITNRYHFGPQGRYQPYWVAADRIRFTTENRQPVIVVGQQKTFGVQAIGQGTFTLTTKATFTVSDTAAVSMTLNNARTMVTINTVKANHFEGTKSVRLVAQAGTLRDTITLVLQALGASSEGAKTVTFAHNVGCALDKLDRIRCWGTNSFGALGGGQPIDSVLRPVPQLIASSETFTDVKAGIGALVCGLSRQGDAYCWGSVTAGSLGDGTLQRSATPVLVQSQVKFKEIAVTSNSGSPNGQSGACAIDNDGSAWCWGANSFGEIGDSTQTARPLPVRVKQPEPFRSISAFNGVCAIGLSGAVYCWGNRNYAGNGDTTNTIRSAPQRVLGLDTAVAKVVTGGSQVCALMRNGSAYCWGNGGRIGDGTSLRRGTASQVMFNGQFIDIAHLSTVTCGLASDGKAYCWGSNNGGQAGIVAAGNLLTPTPGGGGLSFARLASGNNTGCGQRSDGSWFCWGQNTGGKLGDGTSVTRATPVALPIP